MSLWSKSKTLMREVAGTLALLGIVGAAGYSYYDSRKTTRQHAREYENLSENFMMQAQKQCSAASAVFYEHLQDLLTQYASKAGGYGYKQAIEDIKFLSEQGIVLVALDTLSHSNYIRGVIYPATTLGPSVLAVPTASDKRASTVLRDAVKYLKLNGRHPARKIVITQISQDRLFFNDVAPDQNELLWLYGLRTYSIPQNHCK